MEKWKKKDQEKVFNQQIKETVESEIVENNENYQKLHVHANGSTYFRFMYFL